MIDALSPVGGDPAKLKFRTLFSGVSIGSMFLSGVYRTALTGKDSITGYDCVTDIQSFFGSSAVLEVQYLPEDVALTTGTITNQIEATTAASTFSSIANANDLVLDYKYRDVTPGSTSKPQILLSIQRDGGVTGDDVEEIYESFIMMFPADLKTRLVLGGNHFFAFIDYKTHGYLNQGYGDFRLIGQVYKSSEDGNLRLDFRFDTNANGMGVVPSVATSLQTYQYVQFPEADIPLGVPLLFESYLRRPQKINTRSTTKEPGATLERYERDLVSGIWKTGWTNLDTGEFSPLANFIGGVQMGAENLRIRRLFRGMYTTGTPPMQFRMTDWRIYDKIPVYSSLRRRYTYYLAKFYAPLRGSLALTNGTGSPTFTRATACWEFNHIGKLVSIPSGAVRMRGYRPVINRIASSVSFTAWTSATAGSGSVVGRTADYSAAPDGTTTAYRLQLSLGGGTASTDVARIFRSSGVSINRSITSSIQLKTNDGSTVNVGIWLGSTVSIVSVGPNWSRKYHIGSSATDSTLYIGIRGGQTPVCADSVDLLLAEVQTEDTTGQDDKTPAEFVSKGVLSSPWHGAGADGVKYFSTYEDGTDIADADYRGVGLNPNQVINTLLWCRDLTNAAWTKTNVTAALTQTGIDGQANACTLLTATAADGTVSQTITAAAAAGCSGYYVKRSVGTGAIYFSRNGGTSWLDITSEINASDFSLVKIENTSVTNPQIIFKIATSGDAIIVDAGINHLGTKIASCPILTTSASVTVNAETLTYPTSGNIIDAAGTLFATFTADSYTSGMGNIVGSATAGLATSSSYMCQAKDGTNTVNGSTDTPSGTIKIGMAWDAAGNAMHTISENGVETSGTYDDSLGLSTIAILPSVDGYVKDVANFNRVLSSEEIKNVFNS